jgi:hypothetical protein
MNFEKDRHVFILRLWYEPREIPNAAPLWSGEIEYLVTREKIYFRNMAKMMTFILEKTGISRDVDSGLLNRPDDTE